MYLQDGNHIFKRNNLHLNPVQQQIYREIQQQKDKYLFEEDHPYVGGKGATRPYSRSVCESTEESRYLADILGTDPGTNRDPFEDIVEELCQETNCRDGWVYRMIKSHTLACKQRNVEARKNKGISS